MKKRLLSLLTVAIMFCAMLPTASYANEFGEPITSGETVVSYTVNASYVINIPASININENPNLEVTASSMNTNYGQRVSVFIDGSRTYENAGNFYLYKNKGEAAEAKIPCNLRCGTSVANGLDFEVGRFDDGNTTNSVGDPLQFEPVLSSNTPPGAYTGTMYFRIAIS